MNVQIEFSKHSITAHLMTTVFWAVLTNPPFGHFLAFRNIAFGREVWAFILLSREVEDLVSKWLRDCLNGDADCVVVLAPGTEALRRIETQVRSIALPDGVQVHLTTLNELPELISTNCKPSSESHISDSVPSLNSNSRGPNQLSTIEPDWIFNDF